MDYSLQAHSKVTELVHSADRNAQFEYINEQVKVFQARQQPIISVDTKKKEWVGILRITNETGLEVRVRHLPPGTSQWNKIEHRMVAYITPNGRERPLLTHEVIVNLMGSTTPQKGLRIKAELDPRKYEHGIKVMELSDLLIGKNPKLTELFFCSCLCRSLHDEG